MDSLTVIIKILIIIIDSNIYFCICITLKFWHETTAELVFKVAISEDIWLHCAQGRVPLTLGPGAYLIDAGGGGSSRDRTSFEDVLPQVLSGPWEGLKTGGG